MYRGVIYRRIIYYDEYAVVVVPEPNEIPNELHVALFAINLPIGAFIAVDKVGKDGLPLGGGEGALVCP